MDFDHSFKDKEILPRSDKALLKRLLDRLVFKKITGIRKVVRKKQLKQVM
jgi:hypothetical protein